MRADRKPQVVIPVRRIDERIRKQWENIAPYTKALKQAGFTVRPLAATENKSTRRRLLNAADAICFVGGCDIEPKLYGAKIKDGYHVVFDRERDDYELDLLEWTTSHEIPVLAICRGIQLLNVFLGGTLWQDLKLEAKNRERHSGVKATQASHEIIIRKNSLLREIAGKSTLMVNSTHHQAIRKLGSGLEAVAHSPAGIVEAIEMRDYPFGLGVQFHPEELAPTRRWAQDLFKEFYLSTQR